MQGQIYLGGSLFDLDLGPYSRLLRSSVRGCRTDLKAERASYFLDLGISMRHRPHQRVVDMSLQDKPVTTGWGPRDLKPRAILSKGTRAMYR